MSDLAEQLMSLTYKIRKAYLGSRNLNREVRLIADEKIAELNDELYRRIRGEGDIALIWEWPTRITDICAPILNSRRFSETITAEIKNYIQKGSTHIALGATEMIVGNSSEMRTMSDDRHPKVMEDQVITREKLELVGSPMRSYLEKKRKRANNKSSPSQENSPTKVTPPSKRWEEDVEPGAKKMTDYRGIVTIRIKVNENGTFITKLKAIKTKVNTEGVKILGVRKCRDAEDILIKVLNEAEAEILAEKLRGAGETVEILTDFKKRLHILNLDASVEDEELRSSVSRISETAIGNIKIIYRREGFAGSQSACIELPGRALKTCLSKGSSLQVGWTKCKIREYAMTRACFRCMRAGHRAANCPNQPEKKCYKCGSNDHLMQACKRDNVRQSSSSEEKYLPSRYLPGPVDSRARDDNLEHPGEPENKGKKVSKIIKGRSNSPVSTEIRRMAKELERRENNSGNNGNRGVSKARLITIGQTKMEGNKEYRDIGTQTMEVGLEYDRNEPRTVDNSMTWSQVVKKRGRINRTSMEGTARNRTRGNGRNDLDQAVVPEELKQRKTQARPTEKWLNSKAIYVSMEDKNFMDTLVHIKSRVQCPTGDTGIRKIRKTRTGAVLLELEDNALAQEWRERIMGTEQEGKITARILSRKMVAKIRGLDILTEAKDVIGAIGEATAATPEELEQVQLLRMIDEPWQERVAIVRVPVRLANVLKNTKGIKIGWTINKVRILDKPSVKCSTCKQWGHDMSRCRKVSSALEERLLKPDIEGRYEKARSTPVDWAIAETERIFREQLANLNNSTAAMDVLISYMDINGSEIAIVAEPPKNRSGVWITSLCGKAAIGLRGGLAGRACILEQKHNVVAININAMVIISCYFPPSLDFLMFERRWGDTMELIRELRIKGNSLIIIAGDFNAQDYPWAMRSDRRGKLITESLIVHDIICLNDGSPTCVRWNGCTAIDATFITSNLARNISGWHVSTEETLSDHRFISYCVHDAHKDTKGRNHRRNPTNSVTCKNKKRWAADSVKIGKLKEEINNWEVSEIPNNIDSPEQRVATFYEKIERICDCTMKAIKTGAPRRKNVYWWNEHTAKARKECNAARRALSRARSKAIARIEQAVNRYRIARNKYRLAIKNSKWKAWKELIKDIDKNPWGLAYKIVNNKLRVPTCGGILTLDDEEVRRVTGELFPPGPSLDDLKEEEKQLIIENNKAEMEIDNSEVLAAARRINSKKAPGPDNVPGIIIKKLGLAKPEIIRRVMQAQMNCVTFPQIWKRARIVMIPKIGVDGAIIKFRPICLIDVMGKVFERIIATRIDRHLATTNWLDERQFGFRTGRSVADAVAALTNYVKANTAAHKRTVSAFVDIKNAFNSLKWPAIITAMSNAGVPEYLVALIRSYLGCRTGYLETKNGKLRDPDDDIVVLCFADDTVILTRATTYVEAVNRCQAAITRFIDVVKPLGLDIAEEKTEFLVYRNKNTMFRPFELRVKGHKIANKVTAKYLGITLDDKLNFSPHIRGLIPKVEKVMATLGRILPNVGGPMEPRRKMLATVGLSVALYGAPIWSRAAEGVINRRHLEKARRACAIRVCAAYRTAPTEALGVLAGIPPLDITAKMRRKQFLEIREFIGYPDRQDRHTRRYVRNIKRAHHEEALGEWQARWDECAGVSNNWTRSLIPEVTTWVKRKHGYISYHLTQFLTGHGTFYWYLSRFKRRRNDKCAYCESDVRDDAEHCIVKCPAFQDIR
ncbi:unnamed protein product, partial [Xylocopa violacea]